MFKRNKNRLLSLNKPKRRNWFIIWGIIGISAVVLFCIIYAIVLYNNLYDSKTANYSETEEVILEQTSLKEIDTIEHFFGDEAYHVVYGKNEQGEEKIIFYPLEEEDGEKNITTIDFENVLSKEQIIQEWQQNCTSCQFVNLTPALLDEEELWEVAYQDEQNRYVLAYYSMDDAEIYERLFFKSMFN